MPLCVTSHLDWRWTGTNISMYSKSSGTKLLERGRILFFSVVAQGERCWIGMGTLTSSHLSTAVMEFSLRNKVATMRL